MGKTIVMIPRSENYHYTLPKGIKTLKDDKVEWYKFNEYSDHLDLKLKDNDEVIEIEPECGGGCFFDEKLINYDSDFDDDED